MAMTDFDNLNSPDDNLVISKDSLGATKAVPDFHSVGLSCSLVDEDPGDGGVEHHVQVGAVLRGSQEGAGHAQPGPVAVGGLSDREACVLFTVQITGWVAWN